MANSLHIPATGLLEVRPQMPSVRPGDATHEPANETNGNLLGPRKLVRPALPPRGLRARSFNPRAESPLLAHHAALAALPLDRESTHAEAFYFQKQVQAQTMMVFVLEDGEHIEGCIEWYDRNAIKVKSTSRMLIYKASIKYLYKLGENHA